MGWSYSARSGKLEKELVVHGVIKLFKEFVALLLPCSAEKRNGYTFLTPAFARGYGVTSRLVCRQRPLRSTAKHSAQVVIPTHRPCRGSQPLHSLASGWLFKIDMASSMNSSSGATSAFDDSNWPPYDNLWRISVLRVVVSFLFRIPILCLNAHGIWYLVAVQ